MNTDRPAEVVAESSIIERSAQRGSLGRRARIGAMWWTALYPLMKIIQLAANVVLAQLLSPVHFGLVALGNSLMQGLNKFSELGLRPAILTHERGDEATFLNTAWTLQVLRGAGLWVIATALAWPAARIYEEPFLIALLPVLGAMSLINGFRSTSLITLNRHLDERPQALLELAKSLLTRIAMVGFAVVYPSPWALVTGTVVGILFNVILSHRLDKTFRNRFAWDRQAVGMLINFGIWVTLGTIIAFFNQQIDRLLIPLLDSFGILGIYSVAYMVAHMPQELFATLVGKVMLPVMSQVHRDDHARFAERVEKIRKSIMPAAIFFCLGAGAAAPYFFGWLYDWDFYEAVWIAPTLVGVTWIRLLNGPANHALLAMGRPRPLMFSALARLIVAGIATPVGFYYAGLGGLIVGMGLSALAGYIWDMVVLSMYKVDFWSLDLRLTGILAAAASLLVSTVVISWEIWPDWQQGITERTLLSLSVTGIVLGIIGAWSAYRAWPAIRAK